MKQGPALLKDWMHRMKFLQVETANYFGCDPSFVSQLLSGAREPGLIWAVKIERLTGIPVEAWLPTGRDESDQPAAVSSAKSQHSKA